MEDFHLRPTICFLVIMLIEVNKVWKPFVFYWLTRSNIRKTSLFLEAIMNVLQSIVFMGFMMNANEDIILNFGKLLLTVLIVYLLLLLLMKNIHHAWWIVTGFKFNGTN